MLVYRNKNSGSATISSVGFSLTFTAVFATLVGYLRWDHGFFIGIQGMLSGLVTGSVAGYMIKLAAVSEIKSAAAMWNFRYRFSVSLVLIGAFIAFELAGIGLAMPQFAPWQWIAMTLEGSHIDLVIGPSRASGFPFHVRQVGPLAWVLFNILDLVLQAILTLLSLGIQLNSPRPP